jgi:hypothetical protein
MQTITNKTTSVIESCFTRDKTNKTNKTKECVNDMIDQIIKEGMKIVAKNPKSKNLNKKLIKDLVKESLVRCSYSEFKDSKKILECIEENISPIIDMAVDIMSELL